MPSNVILIVNAGSSSLKFALFEVDGERLEARIKGQISAIGQSAKVRIHSCREQAVLLEQDYDKGAIGSHRQALRALLDWISGESDKFHLVAAGHRVVHGGRFFNRPQRVSADLIEKLETLSPLAPHHQPHNLSAIRALTRLYPTLPQVACFDTAFHAGQPETSWMLQLPRELVDQNLRRYGFHGLSYESILFQVPDHCAGETPKRIIIAHLGNGASLAAIREGHSLATSMGFSTLDGLIMGSRCGSLDPGVLLYLMREHGLDEAALTDLLYNRSGLLGVSGVSSDMRELLHSSTPGAERAIRLYIDFLIRHIGAYTALLQGLDLLVFTGGVGENACAIRLDVMQRLAWLGVQPDEVANEQHNPIISQPQSRVLCMVIPSDEESAIARGTLHCLAQANLTKT